MQFFQLTFYENMQKFQADYMGEVKQIKEKQEQIYQHNQRFHAKVWKEQEKLAKEVQDIRRGQITQVAANNKRFEAERNLQLALERQGREIAEIRKKNEERKLEEQKGRKLEHSTRAPTPRRGDSCLGVQSSNPGVAHPGLGVATNA
ncbi:hypothetical protein PIB30_094879 [Stylosanthes scabra]|uniref:Uncharacterized protein n=1 Tax=Stylosanthes scabra TaxID=79078 RepID=A0ABU6YTS8_9FABA|nr:hypothetical protein [Stylosanthes scabra]